MEGATLVSSPTGNGLQLSSAASRLLSLFQPTSSTGWMDLQPKLAVWPVSGRSLEVETFQKLLRSSSSSLGGQKHPEPMTPTLGSGWAGVLNGIWIPFQDPFQM